MSRFLNTMASITSLAAFAGVVYWGITLSQLDPNNVPVIKKAMGPARIAPDDPGGEQASFQGLSVNEVQADGGAAKPATKVILAPSPRPFQNEDVAGLKLEEKTNVIAEAETAPAVNASQFDPIPASVTIEDTAIATAQPTTTQQPAASVTAPAVVSTDAPTETAEIAKPVVDASVRRPLRRPSTLRLATPTVAKPTKTEAKPAEISAGTSLVQLGAFDAEVVADVQWGAIKARHADLIGSKTHVIQKAKKGGKTFYRLRVQGFADKSAANGFCTALKARGTDCISVTVR